jgi:intracellular septation protein A
VASVFPMVVFYLTYAWAGLRAAVVVTIAWYYAGLLWRLARRKPVLSAALLGAGLLTLRGVVMLWTGNAFLYFLQPVAGTVGTATAIAVTALAGRPLLERLAHDFVPLPPALTERLRANRFFRYASALWALTYLVNAVGTVWLLSNASLGGFMLLKTLMSPVLTVLSVVLTFALFRLLMRRERVQIRWGHPAIVTIG